MSAHKVFNVQPIEKQVPVGADSPAGLDMHSIFPTIQGEGPFAGQPAVFLRLAGCNLQCPLCDTEYTQGRSRMSVPVIYDCILEHAEFTYHPLIVITGGEPFRQDIGPLVSFLVAKGLRVQIETNGTLYREIPRVPHYVTVVCSPKAGKINSDLLRRIDYFKYVVKAGDVDLEDGLPIHALDHSVSRRVARPPMGFDQTRVYIQPADTQDAAENHAHLQTAIRSARQFGYTLCLQTHKIINLP
jgi:7-carboxy-7-deazaguanine synthase